MKILNLDSENNTLKKVKSALCWFSSESMGREASKELCSIVFTLIIMEALQMSSILWAIFWMGKLRKLRMTQSSFWETQLKFKKYFTNIFYNPRTCIKRLHVIIKIEFWVCNISFRRYILTVLFECFLRAFQARLIPDLWRHWLFLTVFTRMLPTSAKPFGMTKQNDVKFSKIQILSV